MLIDLTDTTTSEVRGALTRARDQQGGPTTGVVLNLIIMTDESRQHDAVRAASHASREHPCRVLAVITRGSGGHSRLDAEIRTGDGAAGQTVLLRLYGPMSLHPDSVVMPLLVLDTPVVTWWPGGAPEVPADEPLGALAQRRVTDAAAEADPGATLRALAAGYQPGDTDLSWTRATSWRSLLAATVDQTDDAIRGGTVRAEAGNPTAELLTAWLASRLRCRSPGRCPAGRASPRCRSRSTSGDITIARQDGRLATLEPARPARPARGPAPAGDGRPDGRGTAPAEPGRGLRRDARRGLRARGRAVAISAPQVLVHPDAELLAQAVAARLVTRLVDACAAAGSASLVLTGGGIGTKVLAELAAAPARDAIDWRHVDIWWGDERFVPAGDPERNETGARAALLDHVDVTPERVHADARLRRAGRGQPGGRRRPLRRRAAGRGPARGPRRRAVVRRAAAGHRPGGPRGVPVPRHARGL